MYMSLTNRYLISSLHAYVLPTTCFVFFKTPEVADF